HHVPAGGRGLRQTPRGLESGRDMRAKLINDAAEKTWAVIFDQGDEVIEKLTAFAKEQKLDASHFTGIGAFEHTTLGYFDRALKDYKKIPVGEQVEVLSLVGDIALDEKGEPKIHAHGCARQTRR